MKKGKTREENRGEDAHRAAAGVLKTVRKGWTQTRALRPNTFCLQMHCCELYEFIKPLKGKEDIILHRRILNCVMC